MITRTVEELEREIDALIADGYRIDMIMPADGPRVAEMSKGNQHLRLVSGRVEDERTTPASQSLGHPSSNQEGSYVNSPPVLGGVAAASAGGVVPRTQDNWIRGRAGMQYRDLIPDRLGGRLIASHIRITKAGPVPDYVHYHKIGFQMIYCKAGWVRVVYEDQGPPFILQAGDCVLQPPEIRHRVLEASAGAEVIELGSPAEHETWIEHDIDLPTNFLNPGRSFGGQTFVRHTAADAAWQDANDGFEFRDLGIFEATRGMVDAKVIRTLGGGSLHLLACGPVFLFVLDGSLRTTNERGDPNELTTDECILIPSNERFACEATAGTQYLSVSMLAL